MIMESLSHCFVMTLLNAGAIDSFALAITLLGYFIVFLALVLLYLTFRYLVPAETDGVIETIKVKPGDAVLQGDILIETI